MHGEREGILENGNDGRRRNGGAPLLPWVLLRKISLPKQGGSGVRVEHWVDKAWWGVNRYFDVAVGGVQRD